MSISVPYYEIITRHPANFSSKVEDDCNCDCACEATIQRTPTTMSNFDWEHTRIQQTFTSHSMALPDKQHVLIYGLEHQPAVLNSHAYHLWQSFERPRLSPVSDAGRQAVERMLWTRLLRSEPMTSPAFLDGVSHPPLSAWLHITDSCNLRCAYCYLPHKCQDMSLDTGRSAIEAVVRSAARHNYQQVKLKYAGGEPLLRFPLVVKLHRHAQKLAESYGLALDGVVLSNGTLLNPAIVNYLKDAGLRLMISLDGIESFHNHQRSFSGGSGSFNAVCDGIELALRMSLALEISVTISSQNAPGLVGLAKWLADRELPFSFNFYRENPASISQPLKVLDEDQFVRDLQAALETIAKRLPTRSLLTALADRANLSAPHLRTCGVGKNYLVIRPDGQIAKCQMAMEQVVSSIRSTDPLADIQRDPAGIQNISVEEKEECLNCEWKYWCCGGCPLMAYQARGYYDVKSPYCGIYQKLFPEILRLEGLRILNVRSVR